MTKKFNINNSVYVKLTDYGREWLKKHWTECSVNETVEQTLDAVHRGWKTDRCRFQAHDLMAMFGPCMEAQCHGQTTIPFETEIEIEFDEL